MFDIQFQICIRDESMISFYILGSLVCSHFGEVFDSPIELGAEGGEDLDFSFHKLLVKGGQRLESY